MRGTQLPRVEVDLNARDEMGWTRTAIRYADLPLQPGAAVVAYQDDTAWRATVQRLTERFAYLVVDWDSFVDDAPEAHQEPEGQHVVMSMSAQPAVMGNRRVRWLPHAATGLVAASLVAFTLTPGVSVVSSRHDGDLASRVLDEKLSIT